MELDVCFTRNAVKRQEMYSNNPVDYNMVMDLVPAPDRVYFLSHMGGTRLSAAHSVSLVLIAHGDFCLHILVIALPYSSVLVNTSCWSNLYTAEPTMLWSFQLQHSYCIHTIRDAAFRNIHPSNNFLNVF
jgi:hypothetical protein